MSAPSAKHQQWEAMFVDRIYQLCNTVHPGMAIDRDAVLHIRELVGRVLTEILDAKPSCLPELEKTVCSLLPQQASGILKEAGEFMGSWAPRKFHLTRTMNGKTLSALLGRLIFLVKEHLGCKEKERKDREKEIERMALFVLSMCDYITEDVLKWTGHYVKNIRNGALTISLQNLQIALNADKNLMELTEIIHNEDEEGSATGTFLFDFDFGGEEESPKRVEMTYDKVAREFLHDESKYVSTLSLLVNVFRRRFETVMNGDALHYLDDIFGNITELHDLTLQVERALEDAIEMSDSPCVGMGLWQLAEAHEFNCYVEYMDTVASTMPGAIQKVLKDPKFANFFESEEKAYSSSAGGQTFRLTVRYVLPALLQTPIVHFYRYIDYINRCLRLTSLEEDRNDLQNVRGYLAPLSAKLDAQLTMELRKMVKNDQSQRALCDSPISQLERLQEIQKRMDGYVGKNIGQTCSELVREGDLQMVRPSLSMQPLDTLRRGRARFLTERRVFLFDQLIVMCKCHKSVLKFKDRLNIRRTEMLDFEDSDDLKHGFRIESQERNANTVQVFTFVCRSREDKESWMSSLMMLQTKSILDRILDNYTKEEKKRIPLVVPGPEQYRFAEPDTEENILFEDYTSSSGIPVVKHGTVVKLVERLSFHLYTDTNYVKTFLISFRSFCTPNELLQLLIERFEVPIPAKLQPQNAELRAGPGGPLAGRFDTVQSHGLSAQLPFVQPAAYSEQSFQRFRKEYERPIQRRVLSVMQQWVKMHWYDFENDPNLLDNIVNFLKRSCDTPGRLTNQHRKFAKCILSTIEKKRNGLLSNTSANGLSEGHANGAFEPDEPGLAPLASPTDPRINCFQPKPPEAVWHTAQKGDCGSYDLLTLHPLEIGRQLTLLHFDLYRAIKPIELVGAAWMRSDKYQKSPQLLKLTNHSNQLTYWVSRAIVDTDSLEERVAMFSRALEVMSVFEELHNFTGLVAFYSALNSTCVHRLTWCWERLEQEQKKSYSRFQKLCNPHWHEMVKRLQSVDPPCVPFFGHYLTSIVFFEGGNSTFVNAGKELKHEDPGCGPTSPAARKVLVSFLKCRRIASVISEIQMYQNQPYALSVEPSIRQFFESINPQGDFEGDEDALQNYLYERSLKIQPKDQDKPAEVKPKRPPHVLKSPGVKAPKTSQANHYSPNHASGHANTPPTPSPRDDAPRSAAPTLRSPTEDSPFAVVDIHPGQHPRYIGDISRRQQPVSIGPLGPVPKKAPPPLHPRRTRQANASGSPALSVRSPGAPPVFPRRPTISPPSTSHSPKALSVHAQAFVFPEPLATVPSPPPQKPPQRAGSTPPPTQQVPSSSSEHRVVLPPPATTVDRAAPSVSVSLSLPPQLPPRVRTGAAAAAQAPPPRPPKPGHLTASPLAVPNLVAPPPALTTPTAGGSRSPSSPPPLPPKTYKARKQSSSPTTSQ